MVNACTEAKERHRSVPSNVLACWFPTNRHDFVGRNRIRWGGTPRDLPQFPPGNSHFGRHRARFEGRICGMDD